MDEKGSHEFFIQQLIYTPENKETPFLTKGDRPYAGYAALGYRVNYSKKNSAVDSFGIDAGLVGSHAYGKEVQREFHKLLGQAYPAGWDTQLRDEPVINFTFERRKKYAINSFFDFVSLGGANLGNAFDQGYLGGTFRIGRLPYESLFAGDTLFPRIARNGENSFFFFCGALGRGVVHNIFLDGNTWKESASVEKKPLVGEARIGVAVEWKNYNASYTLVKQSKEFYGEERPMMFGEVSLGYSW